MSMQNLSTRKLIIIGDTAFAEIAFEYFTHDSRYEVVGFSVEKAYLNKPTVCGLPVVPFEELEQHYSSDEHHVFVATTYTELNRLRERLAMEAKSKGYSLASYVSSQAFVWRNVEIGEHCFIFENNVIQPFVKVGHNVVMWSGNHVGHHSTIGDHCFIASHAVISGFVTIGAHSFIGVNATLINNIDIACDNWIGPGVTVTKSTVAGDFIKPDVNGPGKVSTYRYFKVEAG